MSEKRIVDPVQAARDIERQVAAGRLDAESIGPLVAAARIRAWHESLSAIFAVAEADIMECCLAIRRQHPGQEAFGAFVAEHVRVLTPTKAWQMADTWEVAKQHRPVRELVNREPKKAIAFVREFTAAAAEEQVPLPLDADDREIADILASPPKRRREQLRELVATRRERDHHPDDVKRIRELEAEKQALHAAAAPPPDDDAAAAVEALAHAESDLFEARGRVLSVVNRLPAHTVARVLRICDRGVGSFDEISYRLGNPEAEE